MIDLPDGFAFRLDPCSAVAERVGEFIALERACCPFLSFDTHRDPTDGGTVLEITGREGAKEFLASQFGLGPRR